MVRVVFCDDEKKIREKYIAYLNDIQKLYGVELELNVYSDAELLLSNTDDWLDKTDLLLLDIEMGDYNGVKVAESLRKDGFIGEIVFLTVSKAYVFDAFDVNPIQYILKTEDDFDIFYEKFTKVLDRLGERYVKLFNYQIGSEVLMMPIKNIISFEVKRRIIIMNYVDQNGDFETIEFYMTLANVEEKIKSMNFIKVHRSFIVNPVYISNFASKELRMINMKIIPVSRGFAEESKRQFCSFLELKGIVVD